ncbi:MAG: hypothetical protein ACOX7J_06235 [Bacillota bacterium]|jgi:hypothetical protein
MKKSPLYYVVIAIMAITLILIAWPNILGWGESTRWVMGIPYGQLCIYLAPLTVSVGMGILYLLDRKYEIAKARAKLAERSDEQC